MRSVLLASLLCACVDPLEPPTGDVHGYVVSRQVFATNFTEARAYGLDLDDGEERSIDNQLAMTLSQLHHRDLPPHANASGAIARGEIVQLVEVQYAARTDPDDSILFALRSGTSPVPAPCSDEGDTRCGRHLTGQASFAADPSAHAPLLGYRLQASLPGELTVAIPFFDEIVELDLIGARVKLHETTPSAIAGTIGGGVRDIDVRTKLAPLVVRAIERRVAAECSERSAPPACGCPETEEYGAGYWLSFFDISPKDCAVTLDEFLANALIVSLTAPDLRVGDEQALSFGFAFEAVPARFR